MNHLRTYCHSLPSPSCLCWDADNLLQGVEDNSYLSLYQYDANGERTYKLTGAGFRQNINGVMTYTYPLTDATLYASPYLVATKHGYTKHYYAENERLLCKIGDGTIDGIDLHVVDTATLARKQTAVNQTAPNSQYTSLLSNLATLDGTQGKHPELYWQHSDHLGSASWITDTSGCAVQHLQYMPWGEPLLDYRNSSFNTRYTFSGKERDEETGYSYFGARYYNSTYSIWMSIDPMSDKYPNMSPYVYCGNNPVKLVDPSGEENKYALAYAKNQMINKVSSVKNGDITYGSWYGYNSGQHQTLTSEIPSHASCYEAIWHAYMNSGDKIQSYLKETGFSNSANAFVGRNKGMNWFKEGNDMPANVNGISRSFETDIMKGEVGDIIFMNGHAAMLAASPEMMQDRTGQSFVRLKTYTTTSSSGFIEQDMDFYMDGNNKTTGWSSFMGYGQMHGTANNGNQELLN